ncbi:ATPase domain-containing protein [uncultured Methanomethylovorans sp.]|uniref:ATPase domain-containing protein n=1 Tax=uncultured Methanomethylovorans sp. TaxID=183759 RepID=UPI002AA6872E|nr:ATPase domain-containing protein [uncultured Methanomethylovorans sp.]
MDIVSTGIEGLDEILGGGVLSPSTTFIVGTPGTGRTTLGMQSLCAAAKKGEKVLYVAVSTKPETLMKQIISRFSFFEENINIRTFNVSSVERDPLTMLVELGNIVNLLKPKRILIDSVTPLGFGFPEAERRRFMYSLNSAINEWNAIVYFTGTLELDNVKSNVVSDIVDNIIYLSQNFGTHITKRYIRLMKVSGMPSIQGKHTFEITTDGISVYPKDIVPANYSVHPSNERRSIGIPLLDEMMGGGMIKGTANLLAGSTGTGKTVIGLHFIVEGAKKGEKGVILSLEEIPEQLYLRASNFGWDLKEMEKKGTIKIIHTLPALLDPNKQMIQIRRSIQEIGAQRVFVDTLEGFDYAIVNPVERKEYISSLIRMFQNHEITSLFTCLCPESTECSKNPDTQISTIVDTIITLKQDLTSDNLQKSLSIIKMRGSNHVKSHAFYDIGSNGFAIKDLNS